MERTVIDRSDKIDRWRYACPNGHVGARLEFGDTGYYCDGCRKHDSISTAHHHVLVDKERRVAQ